MRLIRALWIGFIAVFLFSPFVMAAEGKHNFASASSVSNSGSVGSGNAGRAWLAYYKADGAIADFSTVAKFIKNHPDFPAMSVLRIQAERAMPSSISDQDALAWFSANPPETVFGMQVYANALSNQDKAVDARKAVNEWWRRASLSPNDQDKGYKAFAILIDKSSNEYRLRRLIHKDQYTNARALARKMGNNYMALAEARISMRTVKGNVDGLIGQVPSSLQNDEGFLFDRLHWRRVKDNDAGAIEILNKSPSSDKMYDPEAWGKERGIIVRRLFEEGKYSQAYKLASNHKIKEGPGFAMNEWMAGWLALEYLNKPWEAFEHFERLYHGVETPISKSRASYWAGLASEHLGHPDVAKKWYDVGGKYPTTFYGQLSRAKSGNKNPISSSDAAADGAMKNSDLASAARWLRQNGYKAEASMFMNKMIEKAKTPSQFAAIAEVANSLSMKNMAIKAAQECEKVTGTSMVAFSFPKIEKYMTDVDVEWALIHALVRQESRYDSEAVSTAGARGLMQLMPATAKEVARKAGLSHDTRWLTSKPGHNVALGARYLAKLLSKYDGNYAMALAAYNAGPARVDKWIDEIGDPRNPKVDLVNWIEMIPIYETRNYVQRVLEGVYVYRQTLSRNKWKPDNHIDIALQ